MNIANPANPVEVGYCDMPASYVTQGEVAVSGSYVYVANDYAGLRVINVVNPSNPYEVGYYDTPGIAQGVAVSGSYAYVADDYAGLRVINIANPASPLEVGYYNTLGHAGGVVVSGNYAYVANELTGLRVVDVSNPADPVEVGYYDTPGYAHGVAVSGSYVYMGDGQYLGIFDCSLAVPTPISDRPELPVKFSLLPAYPNPFNPTTSLSFTLSTPAGVRLSIFDITGRQITILVNGWRGQGNHRVVLDGSDLASGTYFCQLMAGDFTDVQKIVLLK